MWIWTFRGLQHLSKLFSFKQWSLKKPHKIIDKFLWTKDKNSGHSRPLVVPRLLCVIKKGWGSEALEKDSKQYGTVILMSFFCQLTKEMKHFPSVKSNGTRPCNSPANILTSFQLANGTAGLRRSSVFGPQVSVGVWMSLERKSVVQGQLGFWNALSQVWDISI